MADLFGTPLGTRAYLQDKADFYKAGAYTVNSLADTALKQQQTEKLKLDNEEEKLWSELMRKATVPGAGPAGAVAGGKPASLANNFDRFATMAMEAGFPERAKKLAESASLIRQREASAVSSETTAKLNQLKIVRENAELEGQLFGGVTDESSWVRANALYQFQTNRRSPYADVEYSPEVVGQIKASALSEKERTENEAKRLTREATDKYRSSRLRQHDEDLRLKRARTALEEARERRLARDGGGKGAAGAPTPEEKAEAKRQMKLSGIKLEEILPESRDSAAFAIASRARELQRENRALGRAEAVQQAFQEAVKNGDLEIETVEKGLFSKNERRFRGKGEGPVAPKAAPAAPKERKVGQKYLLPNGKTGVWRDGGWEVQ
jgi:hypothetical protein